MRASSQILFAFLICTASAQLFDSCESILSCTLCNSQPNLPNCGYCVSTGKCLTGSFAGPTTGSCDGEWLFRESRIVANSTSQDVITPDNVTVALRPGVPLSVNITVVPQPMPLDLTILTDVSNSMNIRLLNTLRAIVVTLIGDIKQNIQNNTRIALCSFLDKPTMPFAGSQQCYTTSDPFTSGCEKYVFKVNQQLTNSTAAIQTALAVENLPTFGNLDWAEAALDGLLHTAMCGESIGFRRFTRRIVLVATDADFKVAGDGLPGAIFRRNNGDCAVDAGDALANQPTFADGPPGTGEDYVSVYQLRDALVGQNVYPVVGTYFGPIPENPSDTGPPFEKAPDNEIVYNSLINALGFGVVVPLEASGSNVFDAIETGYRNSSLEVVMRVSNDFYRYVQSIDPEEGYVGAASVVSFVPLYFNVTFFTAENSLNDDLLLNVLGWGEVAVRVLAEFECDCGGISCPGNGSTVCSGRGYCDCGKCVCDDGYTGSECQCLRGITCPGDCSGLGFCDCGECDCEEGWGGPDCSCSTLDCPGIPPCSGNGNCSCGTCTCDGNWFGLACDCTTDPCPGTPDQCSGHGACVCGTCLCNFGWSGDDCACDTTPCAPTCTPPAGNCTCGECACNPGYSGDDCECNEAVPCPGNGTCSGHGTCECGLCTCDPGFTGSPTNPPSYYLINPEENDCSCSILPCPFGTCELENCTCSGHGSCECGACECTFPWTGEACDCDSSVLCPLDVRNLTCGGRGNCSCGACDCADGWKGDACDCIDLPCPSDCSGHGTCGCNGTCICDDPWSREDCSCDSSAVCPVDENGLVCGGGDRGACDCGVCECELGWTSPACNCSSFPCPNDCFGNGNCTCGVCECDEGFGGALCDCVKTQTCPGPDENCFGHGTCDCGVCVCDAGWGPPEFGCNCSLLPCPVGGDGVPCSGRGACSCGECTCDEGWSGEACDCDLSLECAAGCGPPTGNCSCGVCLCAAGYGGEDCTCRNVPCTGCPLETADCTCGECVCKPPYITLPGGDTCACRNETCGCSEYGRCECGNCICEPGWAGRLCTECVGGEGTNVTCGEGIEVCSLIDSCGACLAVEECGWCEEQTRCSARDNPDGCALVEECPTGGLSDAEVTAVSLSIVGFLALVLCVVLAIMKTIQYFRQRAEFEAFQEELKGGQDFGLDANPLFTSNVKESDNPLYVE